MAPQRKKVFFHSKRSLKLGNLEGGSCWRCCVWLKHVKSAHQADEGHGHTIYMSQKSRIPKVYYPLPLYRAILVTDGLCPLSNKDVPRICSVCSLNNKDVPSSMFTA